MGKFEKITKQNLAEAKIGEIVYLKAKVIKEDPLSVSYYGPDGETDIITQLDQDEGIVFCTSHLFGDLTLISPKNNKWGAGQEVLIAHVIVAKNKFNNHVTGQRGNSLETSTGRLVNLSAYEGLVFQK